MIKIKNGLWKKWIILGILSLLAAEFGVSARSSCRKAIKKLKLPPHTKLAKSRGRNQLYCEKGYYFSNGKPITTIQCRRGVIKKPIPSCKGCGQPAEINNGTRTFSGTSVGSKVSYSCQPGFTLVGRRQRKCRKNLKWSGGRTKTICRRNKCRAPRRLAIRNGNVTVTDPSFHEYATLSFECNEGYELIGERDIVCKDNAWSARRLPYCRKKQCPNPGRPENGRRFSSNIRFYNGSTVEFFCSSGFTLYGSQKRTCQADYSWTGNTTTCDDGRFDCRDPGIPIGSIKTGYVYNKGDTVQYRCKSGFRLVGSKTRTCSKNNTWSGVEPKCVGSHHGVTYNMYTCEVLWSSYASEGKQRDTPSKYVQEVSDPGNALKDENYKEFPSINETLHYLREGFFGSLLQKTCSGKNISCPELDNRARALNLKYKEGLDLIFVLDSSSSIKRENFKIAKGFIKKIVEIFGVDERPDGTRIACVTYGSNANLEFSLGSASVRTLRDALNKIDSIKYTRGGTNTRAALDMVRKVIMPMKRKGSKTALFLVTDGNSNIGGKPKKAADDLKGKDVEIYVVGIGSKIKFQSLRNLASGGGDKEHVFTLKDFKALRKIKKWIAILPTQDYSQCGRNYHDPVDARARIVGGKKTKGSIWPWVVRVFIKSKAKNACVTETTAEIEQLEKAVSVSSAMHLNGFPVKFNNFDIDWSRESYDVCSTNDVQDDAHKCGGTIINDEFILTAAHCFNPKGEHPSNVKIAFGRRKISPKTSLQIYTHQNYNSKTYENDIALVKIPKLRRFTLHQQKICIPRELNVTAMMKPGNNFFAVGWGTTKHVARGKYGKDKDLSEFLKEVELPFLSDQKCTDKVKNMTAQGEKNWRFYNNTQFCAGDKEGKKDTCQGDSGGPAMVLYQDEQGKLNWYQVGIVSWGYGCAQKGEYGYYTKVSAYSDWIDKNIQS